MAENEANKQKSGAGLYIVLILLLIIALGVVYYMGFVKSSETIDVLESQTVALQKEVNSLQETQSTKEMKTPQTKEKKEETIPTTDLVALDVEATEAGASILFAYIEDGYLYYYDKYSDANTENNLRGEGAFGLAYTAMSSNKGNLMTKYEGLNNIKRLKTFNVGTGVAPTLFLITEEGKVYQRHYMTGEIKLNEALKAYDVEDILNQTGEVDNVFEVLLKDGTTKTVVEDLGI